ncbi:MAG: methyltransferase domain-containing protein, partial [candidate division WOR-3 bacterium]
KIADGVGSKGVVVGIDTDEKLIEQGNAISREQGYRNVILKAGDAYRLPARAGTFDLVTCHLLLYLLDAQRALMEMIRVCKKDGRVSVMEPLFLRYNITPIRQSKKERFLEDRFYQAKTEYFEKRKKENRGFQSTVAAQPSLFSESGLKNVRVDGESVVFWPADYRHERNFIITGYKKQLDSIDEEIEHARPLLAGKFSEKEVDQLKNYRTTRLKKIIQLYEEHSYQCEFLLTVELIISGVK